MNSKLALTAIVMVAGIMAFGAISPAMAAPNENASDKAKEKAADKGKTKAEKTSICHWQEEELLLDENGVPVLDENGDPIVLEEAEWLVINVSKNALKAHVDKHTDGTDVDTIVDDSVEPGVDTITTSDCLARNNSVPEEPEIIIEE